MTLVDDQSHRYRLDAEFLREFWRMQLLDELHRRLQAFDWSPGLDPRGARRAALCEVIDRYEAVESRYLTERRTNGSARGERPSSPMRRRPRLS